MDKKSAFNNIHMPAALKKANTKKSAAWTGFLAVMTRSAAMTKTVAKA
jgi:hypothetical protein